MDKKYQNFDFPVIRVVFIVASFLLAVLDMLFLYGALGRLTAGILGSSDQAGIFMITAFVLATVANFTALMWGYENGKRMTRGALNKHSIGFFIGWCAIGLGYFAIRAIDLKNTIASTLGSGLGIEEANIPGHIIVMGILAVSYIGTGTLIQSSAREIFDARLSALRKAKKKFERANEDLADSYADLKESIGILKNYDINYRTLDVQYRKCYMSMIRTENATMSVIVSNMLAKHNDMNPKLANDILKEVIDARDDKWEYGGKK